MDKNKKVLVDLMISFCEEQAIPIPCQRLKVLIRAMDRMVKSFQVPKKEEPLSLEESALLVWILHYRLETYARSLGRKQFMDRQKQILLFSLEPQEEELCVPKGVSIH